MEVDVPNVNPTNISTSAPGLETISASSSFEKLDLAGLDLDTLNDRMKDYCDDELWRPRIEKIVEGDTSRWQRFIVTVLMRLTIELAATEAKGSVIPIPTLEGAN